MKFDKERKNNILIYLLEKIEQGEPCVSKTVSKTFDVNQSTIHAYINELLAQGILKKVKRGQYELAQKDFHYCLKRSMGELSTDTFAYEKYIKEHVKDLSLNVRQIWNYVISEMINNVMDHSLAENVDIYVEQTYLNTTVILADTGVGIFQKIKSYFGLDSIDDAICELFKGKLTTDAKNHSGEGIFFSSKMVDEFSIISDGGIFTTNKFGNDRAHAIAATGMKGTCVVMKLSNFSRRRSEEVFDLYADVEGGFVKTMIPLKNIFDTSPVSRSQAKRVCNRLDKFREVIVDFAEINWMGQGFAHQIFVVFAKEHPDISIVPVNMNEGITKMYNHVITSVDDV